MAFRPCVAGRCASSHASRPPTSSSESSPISPPATPTPYPVHAPHQASSRNERNRRARPGPNSRPRHHPSFPHSTHLHRTANAAPRLSRTPPCTFLATVVALPQPLPSSKMHHDDRETSALGPVTDRPVSIPIPLQQRRSAGCLSYPPDREQGRRRAVRSRDQRRFRKARSQVCEQGRSQAVRSSDCDEERPGTAQGRALPRPLDPGRRHRRHCCRLEVSAVAEPVSARAPRGMGRVNIRLRTTSRPHPRATRRPESPCGESVRRRRSTPRAALDFALIRSYPSSAWHARYARNAAASPRPSYRRVAAGVRRDARASHHSPESDVPGDRRLHA